MIKKIDYPKTIIGLHVGEPIDIPKKDYEESTLRSTVSRIGRRENKRFSVKKDSNRKIYTVTRVS